MVLQQIARGGAAQSVVLPRRSFLKGLVCLIAAPAVVRAKALMPIAIWKPTFGYSAGGGGMGPWYTCDKSYLIGVDLDSLGLRLGHDWNGQSDRWYWRPGSFPLATLPLDKVRLPPQSLRARELLTHTSGLAPNGLASSSPLR
jgi:hypothetical protein